MDRKALLSSLFAMAVGLLLLGAGMTGMATVSQSCCSGSACPADNRCTAMPILESPAGIKSAWDAYLGLLLMLAGFGYLVVARRGSRRGDGTGRKP